MGPMENKSDTELLRFRFSELSRLYNELEELVTVPNHDQSELQVKLVRLKNQLRLIEIATSGDKDIFEWDVFISHATEDKDVFVRQLAQKLGSRDLRVWYDEFTLRVGDSLRQSIEKGLAKSRFGIVVLSLTFLTKNGRKMNSTDWLRASGAGKVILPVWLNIDENYIVKYSPILADRVAAKASEGMAKVISDLLVVISPFGNHISITTASLSEATMCKSVDNTKAPVIKSDVFSTSDAVIYCSVKLSNAPSDTKINAQWIYVQGEATT